MKQFFLNIISSGTKESSKRFLVIFFSAVLAVICLWATYKGDYAIAIGTLAGLIVSLSGMGTYENNVKTKQKSLEQEK